MTVTDDELVELIEDNHDIKKKTTISSDGKTLLTRIPKDIIEELNIKKGTKFMWTLNKHTGEIILITSVV